MNYHFRKIIIDKQIEKAYTVNVKNLRKEVRTLVCENGGLGRPGVVYAA